MKQPKIIIKKKLDGHIYGTYAIAQINWYQNGNGEISLIFVNFDGNMMWMSPLVNADGVNTNIFENAQGNLVGQIIEE